jgi:pyridoxine 5-phosphate synthase
MEPDGVETARPMIQLGVNVDHVATLRQLRQTLYPDPLEAARLAQLGGADNITVHLREDRRHIQESDVARLVRELSIPVNLEVSLDLVILEFAVLIRPAEVCFVPERRAERTTENGLSVRLLTDRLRPVIRRLSDSGIRVSLFIDPVPDEIEAACRLGVDAVELHTGAYAESRDPESRAHRLECLRSAARLAGSRGLAVHAGHGLGYDSVVQVAAIPEIETLNIGHAIVSRAVFVGLETATRLMKERMVTARRGTT